VIEASLCNGKKTRPFKLIHFIVGPVVFRVIMFLFLANTEVDPVGGQEEGLRRDSGGGPNFGSGTLWKLFGRKLSLHPQSRLYVIIVI